jgi:hypothetical protein
VQHQYLTVLSMELHADTRGDLMPDPEVDSIHVIFYSIFDDIPPEKGRRNITGAIVVDQESCDGGEGGGVEAATVGGGKSPRRGRGRGRSSPRPSSSQGENNHHRQSCCKQSIVKPVVKSL